MSSTLYPYNRPTEGGTLSVSENGTIDLAGTNYSKINVSVSGGGSSDIGALTYWPWLFDSAPVVGNPLGWSYPPLSDVVCGIYLGSSPIIPDGIAGIEEIREEWLQPSIASDITVKMRVNGSGTFGACIVTCNVDNEHYRHEPYVASITEISPPVFDSQGDDFACYLFTIPFVDGIDTEKLQDETYEGNVGNMAVIYAAN